MALEIDRSPLANLALHDIRDLPADEWSGHSDGREPSEFPRPSLTVRPIDPPTCPPMTIPDRLVGRSRNRPAVDESAPSNAGSRAPLRLNLSWWAGVHRPTTMGSSKTVEVNVFGNFQGDVV